MICVLQLLGSDPGRRDRPIRTGRRDKPIIQLPSIALRVAVIVGIAAVMFGIVFFRLWFLQILSGQEFVAQANDNRLKSVKVVAPRGPIVDRNGEVIVENRPGLAVGIRLMDVPDGELDPLVLRLARVLKMRPAVVRAEIMDHLKPGWPIGEDAPPLTWENVVAGKGVSLELVVIKEDVGKRRVVPYILEHTQQFPGVEIQRNYLRSYPLGDMAAQVLGHLGEVSAEQLKERHFKGYSAGDVVGQDGLEWTYDEWLRGHDGVARVEVDAFGRPKQGDAVPGGRMKEPGDTLVTTIDAKVQAAAEEALRQGISLAHSDGKVEANGGAAVVLDVKNGDVLGMASYPTYDPDVWVGGISTKEYKQLTDKYANNPMLLRPIMEAKAVGSTFKVVDAIAGLEEGIITPYETFFCNGSFKPSVATDKTVWNCWSTDGHGALSLVDAITQSCDVYFYNVGYRFYAANGTPLADWARRLGMEKYTGIDVPGEVKGRVPDSEVAPAVLRDRGRQGVDARQLDQPRHRPGRPRGDAAAARGHVRRHRQRRQDRDAAPRPQDHRLRGPDRERPRADIVQEGRHGAEHARPRAPRPLRGGELIHRHVIGGLCRLRRAGRRQDGHRRGIRRYSRRLRGLRLVRQLRAGQRPQVRGRGDDREGRPRRHRGRAGHAHHLRRPVQHRQRRILGAGAERLMHGRALERGAAQRATD